MNFLGTFGLLVLAALLTACGGASSDATPDAVPELKLVGTAAAEEAFAAATVSVKCSGGIGQVVTADDGTGALNLRGASLPCFIQASAGRRVYRSMLAGSGAGQYRINATPLTELMNFHLPT